MKKRNKFKLTIDYIGSPAEEIVIRTNKDALEVCEMVQAQVGRDTALGMETENGKMVVIPAREIEKVTIEEANAEQ